MVNLENQSTLMMYEFIKHNLVLFYKQICYHIVKILTLEIDVEFRILRINVLSSKNQSPHSHGCKMSTIIKEILKLRVRLSGNLSCEGNFLFLTLPSFSSGNK